MTDPLHILLAEDEVVIQFMIAESLEEEGYQVSAVANGYAGINLLEAPHLDVDVVITDIRMGDGPDGWELARKVRERVPNVPVLYITGDSAGDWRERGVTRSRIIQKPFQLSALKSALLELLSR